MRSWARWGAGLWLVLAVATACGAEDGRKASDAAVGSDAGSDAASGLEEVCRERATGCEAEAGQCELDTGRRDCIIAAESCAAMHGCYMGPIPDGGASLCVVACDRCGLTCDAECSSGDECLAAARSCDAIAACLGEP